MKTIHRKTLDVALAIAFLAVALPAHADFITYNDAVGPASGSAANVTHYSGYLGGGGGFETLSGFLKDIATGLNTPVTATLSAYNVSGGTGVMPNAGTAAYSAFNGIVNLGGSASYGDSTYGWWYQVVFTGLDPTKQYEFVTTANRGSTYTPERWSQFSLIGADSYVNGSSAGTVQVTPDVVKLNGGANTAAGDIVRWTGITAADGSFTVRSENLRDINGKPYGYGMQAFMLAETEKSSPVPDGGTTLALLGIGFAGLAGLRRKLSA